MKLKQLLEVVPERRVVGDIEREITGVVYDPLRVKPGFLYVAINIYTQLDKVELPDGHPFVGKAIQAGANAIMLQKDQPVPEGVTKIVVPESRAALAAVAGEFYGHPSRKFKIVGITGTNGKTTTAHIVESILLQKHRAGLIGTLYYKINGEIFTSKDTTPEPPDLQEIFTRMVEQGVEYCAMEVSSHGMDFYRVDGLDYQVGVYTNLSQDHLDWHQTMENYREAKLKFFRMLGEDNYAVVNIDDANASHFLEATRAEKVTIGLEKPADITAREITFSGSTTDFVLVTPRGEIGINSRLSGQFNLYNSLCGAAACYCLGIELATIKAGLEQKIVVAGRFQPVERGQDFAVIIDYAHTPDGLIKVLQAAKATNPHRLITVFGCGGDRDRSKRPQMAKVVEEWSDRFIITDDNPRTEDPERIVQDIIAGLSCGEERYQVIHDRRKAIEAAIAQAEPGDLIIVAGKGHETTQILKERTLHFNDYEVADEILARVMGDGG